MTIRRAVSVVVCMALLAAPASMSRLRAQSKAVTATLQGVLQSGEFFGPPNYGESPRTDSKEQSFYVQLPATIGDQNPKLTLGPEFDRTSEHFVQLMFSSQTDLLARARTLVGQRIGVTGDLFPAETGHHRTGV